ncbi:unnamed protein product [Diplocarpon coronariae]
MYLEKRPADLVILRLPASRPRAHVLTSSSPTSRSTLADARTSTRPPLLKMTTLASTPRQPAQRPGRRRAPAGPGGAAVAAAENKARPGKRAETRAEAGRDEQEMRAWAGIADWAACLTRTACLTPTPDAHACMRVLLRGGEHRFEVWLG